ncbi:nuclear receptor corepressor 2 [Rhizoclosmatium sp. JEL0117]|nr:nuclear receptor corepressor 2 [Rhizoclosmatium sp. JEL0117]
MAGDRSLPPPPPPPSAPPSRGGAAPSSSLGVSGSGSGSGGAAKRPNLWSRGSESTGPTSSSSSSSASMNTKRFPLPQPPNPIQSQQSQQSVSLNQQSQRRNTAPSSSTASSLPLPPPPSASSASTASSSAPRLWPPSSDRDRDRDRERLRFDANQSTQKLYNSGGRPSNPQPSSAFQRPSNDRDSLDYRSSNNAQNSPGNGYSRPAQFDSRSTPSQQQQQQQQQQPQQRSTLLGGNNSKPSLLGPNSNTPSTLRYGSDYPSSSSSNSFQKRNRTSFDAGPEPNNSSSSFMPPKRPRLLPAGSNNSDRYQPPSNNQSYNSNLNNPSSNTMRRSNSIFGNAGSYDEYKRRDQGGPSSFVSNRGDSYTGGSYNNDRGYNSMYNNNNSNMRQGGGGYSYNKGPGGPTGGMMGGSDRYGVNNQQAQGRDSFMEQRMQQHPFHASKNLMHQRDAGFSGDRGGGPGMPGVSRESSMGPSRGYGRGSSVTPSGTGPSGASSAQPGVTSNQSVSKPVTDTNVAQEQQSEEEGLIAGTPEDLEFDENAGSMEEEDGNEDEVEDGEELEDGEGEEEEEEEVIDDQQLQLEEDAAAAAAASKEPSTSTSMEVDPKSPILPASLTTASATTDVPQTATSTTSKKRELPPIDNSLTLRILAENQAKAKSNSRALLTSLQSAYPPTTPLQPPKIKRTITEYPIIQHLIARHAIIRPFVMSRVIHRKKAVSTKRAELREEWSEHYATYKKKMERLEKKKRSGVGPGAGLIGPLSAYGPAYGGTSGGGGGSGIMGYNSGDFGGSTRSSSRRGAFISDAVKSEAEWEQVLAAIAATEQADLDDSKLIAQTVADPPMLLDPVDIAVFTVRNYNRLVVDPVLELAQVNAAVEMKWSLEEREAFRYRLVQYGKDFPRIAAYLPNKTTQDCIQYYYREKFSGNFKQLLRKAANSRNNIRRRGAMAAKKPVAPIKSGSSNQVDRSPREPPISESTRESNLQQADTDAEADNSNNQYPNDSQKDDSTQHQPPRETSTKPPREKPTSTSKPSTSRRDPPLHFDSQFTISDVADGGSTRWTADEKERAVEAFKKHGRDFEAVAIGVGSKTTEGVKEFWRLYKRKYGLDVIVAEMEAGKKGGSGGGGKEKSKKVVAGGERKESLGDGSVGEEKRDEQGDTGGWTGQERNDFVKGLRMVGCNWEEVCKVVGGGKSVIQCRAYYVEHKVEFDAVLLEAGYKPEGSVASRRGSSVDLQQQQQQQQLQHQHHQQQQHVMQQPVPIMYADPSAGGYVYYTPHPQMVYHVPAPPPPQPVFHPMHGYIDTMPGQFAHPQEYPGASYAVAPYMDIRGPGFGGHSGGYYQPVYYPGPPPPYGYHHPPQEYVQDVQPVQSVIPVVESNGVSVNGGGESTVLPSIRNLISD